VKEIIPCKAIKADVLLPGSKYIANRLVPMCALADGESTLHNVVQNDDINAVIEGLNNLGYRLTLNSSTLQIKPKVTELAHAVSLNTHHSGTFSRFVTAIAALESVSVFIDCSEKMATRPMTEIFETLGSLGVTINTANDCLPARIKGPILNSNCQIDASRSSQFLSALLIIAPVLSKGLTIQVNSEQVSSSYVDMTLYWMAKLGVNASRDDSSFKIGREQSYQGRELTIPGDVVSASYFMGLVAIAGGHLTIREFDFDSVQGEVDFYKVLEKMGVKFERAGNDLVISSTGRLSAVEVDMGEMPDVVQTLAVVACYATGKTRITNIEHLAYKESNRIIDTANEIAKTGIVVNYGKDFIEVEGGKPKAATINTYEDHRMAMSMALLGSKTAGVKILDADVVTKSFPDYWRLMSQVGLESITVDG
jgi:3-phosphoshikimate 1-carboxyvinyltransferase